MDPLRVASSQRSVEPRATYRDTAGGTVRGPKWVKLKRYCELYGDTKDAVNAKRKKGIWRDGVHCRIAGDHRLWVNLEEVERWVESTN